MGIFSFGKKDDDAPPRRGGRTGTSRNVRTERTTERVERRSRRTERPESDALLLDPTLPEKQRARRRLVGAIALVVALDQRGGGAGNRDPLEEPASPFERTPLSRERCKKRSKAA